MTPDLPAVDVRPDLWAVVVRILRAHVPSLTVWAFGSRVQGRSKPFSDLDLAIITTEPLPLVVSAALAEAFDESELPWKVDILDWATADEAFRRIVQDQHVVVQVGQPLPGTVRT